MVLGLVVFARFSRSLLNSVAAKKKRKKEEPRWCYHKQVDEGPKYAEYVIARFDDIVFVMEDVDAASKVVRADRS